VSVDALFLFTAAVAFTFAAYRGLAARSRRKRTRVPQIVIAVALGCAFVSLAPTVQAVESELVPSLGRLISNLCTIVAAFGFLHLALYIAYPAEQVRSRLPLRLATLLVAIVLMVVMFAVSSPPQGLGIFTGLYQSQPTLAVYALTYSLYLGVAVVDLQHLAVQAIRHTRRWLRAGMAIIAVGCLLSVGYLLAKVVAVVTELVTGQAAESYCTSAFDGLGCTFAVGLPALAVLTLIVGTALPALGPQADRLVRVLGHWRAYRRLEPLWRTVCASTPQLAEQDDVPTAAGVSERLYRRVVAIRDCLLALRPYRDPADTRHHTDRVVAAGTPVRHQAAAVEARDIVAALQRQHQDSQSAADSAPPVTAVADIGGEIRWLTRVSAALGRWQRHDRDGRS
jgi:hypothetical protein